MKLLGYDSQKSSRIKEKALYKKLRLDNPDARFRKAVYQTREKELDKAAKTKAVKEYGLVQRKSTPIIERAVSAVRKWGEKKDSKGVKKFYNFFAHKTEMETYGDEGLTFFDGEKRGSDDTGALFGLH